MVTFDLSIIIPTLNEAEFLPGLLEDIARQKGISIEVVVSDGTSTDATVPIVKDWLASERLHGACLVGPRGRGRQMNAGALQAKADWLLFLHADSRLADVNLLSEALDHMTSCREHGGAELLAGRFPLCFDSFDDNKGFGFYYYESKARIGRAGCIHGDQGMLLKKSFFKQVGPFRKDLPVMEDTSLAEVIRCQGKWVLLPGKIVTSARRFSVEGIKSRQTLNALMMNFLSIGWLDFFDKAPALYHQQDQASGLRLRPFYNLISDLLEDMPAWRRREIWLATGKYVRGQAWQLGLAMDCRKAHKLGHDHGSCKTVWLSRFDRWFDPLTDHCLGHVATALLVRLWFAWQKKFSL